MNGTERAGDPHNVLFLCTGNSVRSIMAEAILNAIGPPRLKAYSAGSRPKGNVHPEALRLLTRRGYDTTSLHSKSWNEFSDDSTIPFGTVITVCSRVAGEVCPVIPGQPARLHWDIPDPASMLGDEAEIERAFQSVYDTLAERIVAIIREHGKLGCS